MVPERCLTLALAGTKAFELEVQPDIPRGKFLDGSAPRSNGFLIPSQRRRDQRLGKKAPATILQAMRPSLAVDYRRMSRMAKGRYCNDPLVSKQALAQIAKSGGLRFHSELPAVL